MAVPDLPGCFSAGDTLDEAIDKAREAIDFHCETLIEDGGEVPLASPLTEHQADPDFAGWIWAVVEVPVERHFGPAEKINITLPRLLLVKIDRYAKAHGATRPGKGSDGGIKEGAISAVPPAPTFAAHNGFA